MIFFFSWLQTSICHDHRCWEKGPNHPRKSKPFSSSYYIFLENFDLFLNNVLKKIQTTLIEPTSGNMGISMAFMAAMKGYKMVLTMPSYTSLERRVTMRAFGADLILTDPAKGMGGTVKKAYQLLESSEDAFMLQQFSNPVNTQVGIIRVGARIYVLVLLFLWVLSSFCICFVGRCILRLLDLRYGMILMAKLISL